MQMKCSECGGDVTQVGNNLVCTKCQRSKSVPQERKPETVQEIDLNDDTKDLDVLMD